MNKINRKYFIGYPCDDINPTEFIDIINNSIRNGYKNIVAVQNANKMYLSNRNKKVQDFIRKAKVILPENSVGIGMALLNTPLKQYNMGGVIMMQRLLELSSKCNYSIYFLGGNQSNLHRMLDVVLIKYQGINICGSHHGYYLKNEEKNIVNDIKSKKPNILFVGMGSPKQEIFLLENYDEINSNIMMGVGGSFNVVAGIERRAPKWTKYGLEWLFRSIQDPKKLKRYIKINSFYAKEFLLKGVFNFKKV